MRIDAEYYSKYNILLENTLKKLNARKLEEFACISDGNHMSVSEDYVENGIPYYRGTDIYNDFIEFASDSLKIAPSFYEKEMMKRSHLQKGDILMSIVGAIIGNVSIVSSDNKATCSCKLSIIRPKKQDDTAYIATYLKTKFGQSQIQKYRRGGGQTGLILEDLNLLFIPEIELDIKDKVKTIVETAKEKLSESISLYQQAQTLLNDELNINIRNDKTPNVNIKTLSQSFFASGRLDAEHYQEKYDKVEDTIKNYRGGWDYVVNLCNMIDHGKQPPYVEGGEMRVFSQKWIKDTEIDYSFIDDTEEPRTSMSFAEKNSKSVCKKYDILHYSVGANIGYCHAYLSDVPMMPGSFITLIRAKEELINPIFLSVFLNSAAGRLQCEKRKSGTAQPYIYPKDIKQILVPIFPEYLQQEISTLVQKSFVLKSESKQLLEEAKTMVEREIEK